jgi:hypothetical protein
VPHIQRDAEMNACRNAQIAQRRNDLARGHSPSRFCRPSDGVGRRFEVMSARGRWNSVLPAPTDNPGSPSTA